jgi:hypothetical protein
VNLIQARRGYTPKADPAEARRNFDYDMGKFLMHSSTDRINPDPVALEAYLTSAYHSLEEGMTMETPKAGFGLRKLRPAMAAIAELERMGEGRSAIEGARGCMRSYVRYHDERGLPLPAELEAELRAKDGWQQTAKRTPLRCKACLAFGCQRQFSDKPSTH